MSALALPDLAQAIEAAHEAVIGAGRTVLEDAVRCGELLMQAKAEIGHGDWIEWLEANCSVRPWTAQVYMRLARELPKLSDEKAQRVALLSIREAVVAVSHNAARIAALREADQGEFLALAETTGDPLTAVHHQHRRAKQLDALDAAKAAVPPVHASPDRRKRLLKNANEHRLLLVIGPNSAGLHLDKHMQRLKDGEQHRAKQREIDDLRRAADELDKQAAELRREALQRSRELKAWAAAALAERHGPVRPFIETATYSLDAETFDELSRLPEQEAIAALLDNDMAPLKQGYWGDIQHLKHVGPPQPTTEWTNVGNEHGLPPEIVASIIPIGGGGAP